MRPNWIALPLLLLTASPALAQTLSWRPDDPAIRRKAQLAYIERVDGKVTVPAEPRSVTQRGNVYLPHVLPVVAGTQVVFKSEDPELHNVFARGDKRVLFNDAVLPKLQSAPKAFTDLGVVHLTCNIHKEMSAYIVVLQNPFFSLPDKDGAFTITGLPAGTYTVRVWGEQLSDEQKAKGFPVTLKNGGVQWAAR